MLSLVYAIGFFGVFSAAIVEAYAGDNYRKLIGGFVMAALWPITIVMLAVLKMSR